MTEDDSPKVYSHCPTERNKLPTEPTMFFGAYNTLPKSEITIISEEDHVSSVNSYTRESDFSSTIGNKFAPLKGRLKSEDEVDTHIIKSVTTEKGMFALNVTTNPPADDSRTENFISAKVGNISSPLATFSLIDFPTNLSEEEILLSTIFPGDKNVPVTSKVSGVLEKSTTSIAETQIHLDKKDTADLTNSNSSDTFNTEEVLQVTNSFIPEGEISSPAENNVTTFPDITAREEEKLTEIDLVLSEENSHPLTKLTDSGEENFITVFELTATSERDKDNPEGIPLTDEESIDKINVWTEGDSSNKAEAHSVLLTAMESRYDFIVPKSVSTKLLDDSPTTTMKDLSENEKTEAVTNITLETTPILHAPIPIVDTLNHLEDSFTTDMDLFELLGVDPDRYMI
ncbi:calcium-binding and spermatid-specific protein 1 [Rhynchocyon petersi]